MSFFSLIPKANTLSKTAETVPLRITDAKPATEQIQNTLSFDTCSFETKPKKSRSSEPKWLTNLWRYTKRKAKSTKRSIKNSLLPVRYHYPAFIDNPKFAERFLAKSKVYREAYLQRIKSGNYNKKRIDFIPAKTVEEALQFARENGLVGTRIIGAHKNSKSDLQLINKINKYLCQIHNQTEGKAFMPRAIVIKDKLASIEGHKAAGGYEDIGDFLFIPRDCNLTPHTIYHEIGHANHSLAVTLGRTADTNGFSDELNQLFEANKKLIIKHIGSYAATNPYEFIADAFACKLMYQRLPFELDELYLKLQGPDII